MGRLVRNAGRCKVCGETIESKHRHDFRTCGCGAISVDGGLSYLRRCGTPDLFEELSEWADDETLPLKRSDYDVAA